MKIIRSLFLLVSIATASVPALAQTASLSYVSEAGDYIGQGQSLSFNSGITATGSSDGRIVSVSVNTPEHWYYLDLAAPTGQALASGGVYENAQRYPFQASDRPGLSFSGDGRGCNQLTGRFEVTDIKISAHGYIERLRANFEQHCEGAVPALFGQVDIVNPPPPPALEINVQLDTKGIVSKASGQATVGGTVTCTVPTTVYVNATLTQRTNRTTVAQGGFQIAAQCSTTPTRFSSAVNALNGTPFVNGAAQYDATASASDPTYPGSVVRGTDSTVVMLSRK
jgi:hypothetical protein